MASEIPFGARFAASQSIMDQRRQPCLAQVPFLDRPNCMKRLVTYESSMPKGSDRILSHGTGGGDLLATFKHCRFSS